MSENECIICAEIIDENNESHDILKCEHNSLFHKKCLDEWSEIQSDNNQNLACPICRVEYGDTERLTSDNSILQVDNSTLFDILKFNRYRYAVMLITGMNAIFSLINIIYGNLFSVTPFLISILGYFGAKTLQKCWIMTYILFNLISLLVQASFIPHMINDYDQNTWLIYCIGLSIDIFLLIYVIIFFRQISRFRSRMDILRNGIEYNYTNIP